MYNYKYLDIVTFFTVLVLLFHIMQLFLVPNLSRSQWCQVCMICYLGLKLNSNSTAQHSKDSFYTKH